MASRSYVNKFGVAQVKDPFIYTTVKNSAVVIGLLVGVGLLASWKELRALTPTRWFAWIGLGVIGGGIPFLLFFQGLSTASAASAALVQKSLFLWVALLALPLLKERLGAWQVLGLAVLAVGQFLLYASNKVLHFRRNPELKCIGQNLLTKFYTFLPLGAFPRITAR